MLVLRVFSINFPKNTFYEPFDGHFCCFGVGKRGLSRNFFLSCLRYFLSDYARRYAIGVVDECFVKPLDFDRSHKNMHFEIVIIS